MNDNEVKFIIALMVFMGLLSVTMAGIAINAML